MFTRNRSRLVLLTCLASAGGLLVPVGALALGLGDIHLKSSLDAPLSAYIDVLDANADDVSTLKASLASRDTFTHFGADYPAFLGTVNFTVEHGADGRAVLHVTSTGIANEPFATLLVEADWARGHVVREYTVLLDPPTFTSAAPSNAAVQAPSVDSGARSGSIDTSPAPAANAAAASAAAAAPGPASAAAAAAPPSADSGAAAPAASSPGASAASAAAAEKPGSYTVQRGDTLSSIAAQTYQPANRRARDRALVAIYRANPRAFDHNMNVLRAGSVLTLPGDAELDAIGPGEARAEVRQQYDGWRESHGAAAGAGSASAANAPAAAGASTNGQLRLVTPQQPAQEASQQAAPAAQTAPLAAEGLGGGTGTGAGSAGAKNQSRAALQQRVQQLQGQLADKQRLLDLKDAQLAAVQAQLQQAEHPSATPAPAASATPPAVVPPGPTSLPAAPVAAPAAAATPAAVTPKPAPPTAGAPGALHPLPAHANVPTAKLVKHPIAHPKAPAEPGNSVLDLLIEYWYIPAGLLAVIIALLVLRTVRSRQDDGFDQSLTPLPEPDFDPSGSAGKPRGGDTLPVRTMGQGREEPSYSVEESGSHPQPNFDEPLDMTAATGQHVAIDEGVPGEVPVALDQGDPLAEADFHMAYGLYDQAAELVQGAIAREPARRDLKLKLLEVFFVWGNKDRFLQSAHELAATRAQASPGEWEKIVIMGRQIAPEEPLFADERAVAGAASGGIDLNLEGGQNRVDFDLLGEPSIAAAHEPAVHLDFGSALGQNEATGTHGAVGGTDPTSQAHALGNSIDFVVDGPEPGGDATGTTRKMPGSASSAAVTREMPAVQGSRGLGDTERVPLATDAAGDSPTVEQPQLRGGDHATIRQKLDAATRHGMLANDQTAELAIDDLGLDLGALDAHEEHIVGATADSPTLLAHVDEQTHQALKRAHGDETAISATQTQAVGGTPMRATGTWLFTDTDFASMAPVKGPGSDATQRARTELITQIAAPPPVDNSSTARVSKLDPASLDLDLSSLDSLQEGERANGVDLDVGASDATTRARAPTNGEDGLPDLEPVTLSEVGTKLDLARAYMDMGDPEGARSILSEVLSEGSLSQKQEARRLMDALPG